MEITESIESTNVPTLMGTRGWAHYQVEDYVKALSLLKRTIAAENSQNVFHYHLGMTYYKLDDIQSSKSELLLSVENGADYFEVIEAKKILEAF